MKSLAKTLIVAAVAGFAGAAVAADLPVKAPAYAPPPIPASWTGLYIGINGGGGFGTTGAAHRGLPFTDITANGDFNLDHDRSGWLAGGQLGYNWQAGRWLWGLEADFDAADINGSGTLSGLAVAQRDGGAAAAGNFVTANSKIDFFGTLRGRLGGLVTDDLLVYATGGLAYANIKTSGHFHYATPQDYFANDSGTRAGWTIGGGLEYRVAPGWTIKAEYLYYDLGTQTIVSDFGVPVNPPFQSQFEFTTRGSIARAGINYQFSPAPAAVAARY